MLLSREFADAVNEFVSQWQAKSFANVDQLVESINNLNELVEKEQELDLVDISPNKTDG